MWIINDEIGSITINDRLLVSLVQIDEETHEDQTYNSVDTKCNISAEIGREKTAK